MVNINALILILIWIFISKEIRASTKYKLIVERFGTCVGPEYSDVESPLMNIKFVKINRTSKAISADLYLKRPVDETLGGIIKFKKVSGGETAELPLIPMVKNPCTVFLRYFQSQFSKFLTNLGVKNSNLCPIPPGNYSLKNYVFDEGASDTSMVIPMVGTFIIRTMVMDLVTKKIIVCIETLTEHIKEYYK